MGDIPKVGNNLFPTVHRCVSLMKDGFFLHRSIILIFDHLSYRKCFTVFVGGFKVRFVRDMER